VRSGTGRTRSDAVSAALPPVLRAVQDVVDHVRRRRTEREGREHQQRRGPLLRPVHFVRQEEGQKHERVLQPLIGPERLHEGGRLGVPSGGGGVQDAPSPCPSIRRFRGARRCGAPAPRSRRRAVSGAHLPRRAPQLVDHGSAVRQRRRIEVAPRREFPPQVFPAPRRPDHRPKRVPGPMPHRGHQALERQARASKQRVSVHRDAAGIIGLPPLSVLLEPYVR